jgi:hypothetical protein
MSSECSPGEGLCVIPAKSSPELVSYSTQLIRDSRARLRTRDPVRRLHEGRISSRLCETQETRDLNGTAYSLPLVRGTDDRLDQFFRLLTRQSKDCIPDISYGWM